MSNLGPQRPMVLGFQFQVCFERVSVPSEVTEVKAQKQIGSTRNINQTGA